MTQNGRYPGSIGKLCKSMEHVIDVLRKSAKFRGASMDLRGQQLSVEVHGGSTDFSWNVPAPPAIFMFFVQVDGGFLDVNNST